MKNKNTLIIGFLFLIVILSGYVIFSNQQKLTALSQLEVVPSPVSQSAQKQTFTEGNVIYTFDIQTTNTTSSTLDIKVILDTHTGSLDQDLTSIITLQDDKGNLYSPIEWKGSPPGGHHREGVLRFPPINPQPKSLELIVKSSPNENRVRWNY